MKRLCLFICFALFQTTLANDVSLSVCQMADNEYQFAISGQVDSWSFENASAYDLQALTASGEGVKLTVYFGGTTLSIYGYPDAPFCAVSDGWRPNAPSILIPTREGVFKLEIWGDGRWWLVTDDSHPDGIALIAQNGYVELIGSVGQDVDPTHYRLIEVTP